MFYIQKLSSDFFLIIIFKWLYTLSLLKAHLAARRNAIYKILSLSVFNPFYQVYF